MLPQIFLKTLTASFNITSPLEEQRAPTEAEPVVCSLRVATVLLIKGMCFVGSPRINLMYNSRADTSIKQLVDIFYKRPFKLRIIIIISNDNYMRK